MIGMHGVCVCRGGIGGEEGSLKIQVSRSHLRLPESKSLGWCLDWIWILGSIRDDHYMHSSFTTTGHLNKSMELPR